MKTQFKNQFIAIDPNTGELVLESISEIEEMCQLYVSSYYNHGWSTMAERGWIIMEVTITITPTSSNKHTLSGIINQLNS